MQVKLNCWRDGHNPGDVVDLDDVDAAVLIAHGAAAAVDDLDVALDAAAAAKVVRGQATLAAASGADTP